MRPRANDRTHGCPSTGHRGSGVHCSHAAHEVGHAVVVARVLAMVRRRGRGGLRQTTSKTQGVWD